MSVIADIEKQALELPEQERAKLANRLIASLPPDFTYEEEIEEALRRSREMTKIPVRYFRMTSSSRSLGNGEVSQATYSDHGKNVGYSHSISVFPTSF